jgi:hypothetical protein
MLFHVYDEPVPEGYFDPKSEPFGIYRQILDADWLLYILLPLLLIIVVAGLMLAWRVHEIPKHKADHKTMRQAELVTALTLLGLFQHWVWAVALFIAYMDWGATEDWFVRILRRAQMPEPAAAGAGVVTAAAPQEPARAEPAIAPAPPTPAPTQAVEIAQPAVRKEPKA